MRELIFAFAFLALAANEAAAGTTLLYFRIAAGVRTLSTTSPEASETGFCKGVDSSGNQGCDVIDSGAASGDCSQEAFRFDPSNPIYTYRFVVPEYWGKDPGVDETGFRYFASMFPASGDYTEPKIKVTYLYKDTGGNSGEVMGTTCSCALAPIPAGCPLVDADIVQFDKGDGKTDTAKAPSPSLIDHLSPGSTVLVEVWSAAGVAKGELISTPAKKSYIVIPFSKDNYVITDSVEPHWIKTGLPATVTIKLDNTKGAPQLTKVEIVIPGNIQPGNLYFDNVIVTGKTHAGGIATVTQAIGTLPGLISIDYSADQISIGQVETITFTCVAPAGPLKNIKWDVVAYKDTQPYMPTQAYVDSQYMAVLDDPQPPTGLTVNPMNTTTGGGWLKLSWIGPPIDANAVTAYRIFRRLSSGGPTVSTDEIYPYGAQYSSWKPVTNMYITTAVSFDNSGLINNTPYWYVIRAVNPVGESADSTEESAIPYADPGAPDSSTAWVSDAKIEMDWKPSVGGTYPLAGYQVYTSTCINCKAGAPTVVGPGVTLLTDAPLLNTAVYYYSVRAYDNQGHYGPFTRTVCGRPAVNPTTALAATYDYTLGGVLLSWSDSPYNSYAVTGYIVYRQGCLSCPTDTGFPVQLVSPPAVKTPTLYLDSSALPARLYYYSVSTLSIEGAPPFKEGQRTPTYKLLTPPATPTLLTAKPAAGAALYLEWSTLPNAGGTVFGYRVYSSSSAGMPIGAELATRNGQYNTSYLNSGLAMGGRYYYRVAAFSIIGSDSAVSTPSSDVIGVVEPGTPAWLTGVAGDGIVNLRWADLRPAQEVDHYKIYRSTNPSLLPIGLVGTAAGTCFADTTVTNELTYYYKLEPWNLGGKGGELTTIGIIPFVPPDPPGWLTAVSGVSQITLIWEPAVETSYPVVGYQVYRATYAGGEVHWFDVAGGSTSVYTDGGTVDGTPYFYVVRTVDERANVSMFGNEAASVSAIPPCPPAALSALSYAGPLSVALAWTAVDGSKCPAPSTFPVSGYRVYRSTSPGGGYLPIAPVTGAGIVAYTDTTVTGGITYYYAVRSFDRALPPNESLDFSYFNPYPPAYSPQTYVTPRVPAAAPTSLTVPANASEHDGKLKLSWVASVQGSLPVIGYNLYRSTVIGGPETSQFITGGGTETCLDNGLVNKKYYYYRLVPVEEKWFEGPWADVSGTPYQSPTAPVNLTLAAGDRTVNLGWDAPATTTFPAVAYRIYRATYTGIVDLEPGLLLNPTPLYATYFADTGVTNGLTVYYHVKTYDQMMHVSPSFSAEISGTPFAAPSAPTGLDLSPEDTRMTVSWDPAVPGTYPVGGYILYRANGAGMSCPGPLTVTITGAGTYQFVDTGLAVASTYWYRVAAYDAISQNHLSACSAEQNAKTLLTAGPPGQPFNLTAVYSPTQINLAWSQAAPSPLRAISGYVVYRKANANNTADISSPDSERVERIGVGTVSYADATVQAGNVYYYRIRTFDHGYSDIFNAPLGTTLYSTPSIEASAFVAVVPSGLAANCVGPDFNIDLTWTAVAAPPGPLTVVGYNIYRSLAPAGPYAYIGNVVGRTTVAYTDINVTQGLLVYYKLAALHDWGWVSQLSGAVSKTPAGPPSVQTLSVEGRDNSALLGWTASSGMSPLVSTSVFAGSSAGFVMPAAPVGVFAPAQLTWTVTGLANGTRYYYRLLAGDQVPLSSSSNEVSVMPLGTPQFLSALPADSKVTLNWGKSPNGYVGTLGYFVYRKTAVDSEAKVGTVVGAATMTYTDLTALNGVTYTYRVRAVDNTAVPTAYSLWSGTVVATPATPASAPTITAMTTGNKTVSFCWSAPTFVGTNPVSGYRIYRSSDGKPYSLAGFTLVPTACFAESNLTNGVSWSYQVAAFDASYPSVEGPWSNTKTGVPFNLPGVPAGLVVTPSDRTNILTWPAAAVTTFPINGYNIYRGLASGGEAYLTSVVAATTLADTGPSPRLVNGTAYWYYVRARDLNGNLSAASVEASGIPYLKPGRPLRLTPIAGNTIMLLSWVGVTPGTYPLSGYNIYRSSCFTCSSAWRVGVVQPATKYTDSGLDNDIDHYYYRVRAVDTLAHESDWSVTVSAKPDSTIVNPPENISVLTVGIGSITVGWTPAVNGTATGGPVTQYVVIRVGCPSCGPSASVYVPSTATFYVDTVANSATLYYTYTVRSVNAAGKESGDYAGRNMIAIGNTCMPPGAPGPIAATVGYGGVLLTWTAPSTVCPVTGYHVERSQDGGGVYARVATISNLSFTDRGLTNGTSYIYRINAVNSQNQEGPYTTSAAVIPQARPNSCYLSRNAIAPMRGDRLDISYTLEKTGDVICRIYTISGMLVYETREANVPASGPGDPYLVKGTDSLPGWDVKAVDGQFVASGVYVVAIESGKFKKMLKVIVLK
jgi:fibronectin type 3 domain-containing protein